MRSTFLHRFGFLLLLLVGCLFHSEELNAEGLVQGRVRVGGRSFLVEIAGTPQAIEKGLMNRSQLAPGQGMLFVFPTTANYPFWMKNTLIPLDVVWIDENLHVLGVTSMAPCTKQQEQASGCPLYRIEQPIRYALEVNTGECDGCSGEVVIEK